ncbi:flagellar hook protein FlgE [Novosphingobium sp. YJ-S2-02]|uniref:Flagellar hook protein FlgE n=1 Tax=Novosphingobium aureum TaxID=2792964 RepID=A0A931MKE4_9SPHN|nr:flagellar hook protein FlgE [Novosphingobium aureum]MBH0111911.1 flagellar hook protein FlgE [Novosphingobium aureum]
MSLYSALYAGVSGLGAQASAMATVADNITNVNTTGYKGVSAQFQTLVTDGSVSNSYSAGGVTASPKALISKQGMLQASSSLTDIAIDGDGFFVVRTGADADSAIAYTRAGSFTTDSSGYLRNTAGLYLTGWPLDSFGNFTNNGDLSALQPVQPAAMTGAAQPTTNIALRANLNSNTTPLDAAQLPYTAGDMTTGAVTPSFSRSVEVFDEQGSTHTLTFNFVKTAANQWIAEIAGNPADIASGADANGVIASGAVVFNADGSIDANASDPALFGSISLGWANGAGSQPISLDLGTNGQLDGLTQFASTSTLLSSNVNGGMLGTVASVEISDTGVVSAIFDDGTTMAIYQLPIATFQNPDGLTRIAGNAYQVSQQSGSASINEPGSLGAGKVSASTLEASNVDLAQEFSNMILFQRAYSASSKIITTVDEMLQEVSNLKR